MTFTEAKVGDYIFRPKPGISYKHSLMIVLAKGKNTITLVRGGIVPTESRAITIQRFNDAGFEKVTGEMIAMEFEV